MARFWRQHECTGVIEYSDFTWGSIDTMATLTIRDLDETLKHSME